MKNRSSFLGTLFLSWRDTRTEVRGDQLATKWKHDREPTNVLMRQNRKCDIVLIPPRSRSYEPTKNFFLERGPGRERWPSPATTPFNWTKPHVNIKLTPS